jgi:hypothetical protein
VINTPRDHLKMTERVKKEGLNRSKVIHKIKTAYLELFTHKNW